MRACIKHFFADEAGAVTVDWVVLTAAVVGLGFAVISLMANGTSTVADHLSSEVAAISPDAGF